ncbi:MAG: hypothetical protein R6U41_12190 [Desulfosalsimonas sp.]|uniref:DNA polymerase III subunit delta n=1 Tax=Desulfosalsimonas sp. TaxID=3073848 RepID=UPI00397112AE
MSEISHRQTGRHLEACQKNGFSPVYLIFGEPYLCRRARQSLVEALIPDEQTRQVSLEVIDAGEGQGASQAVESVGTFSFFSGPRVVVYEAPALFGTGTGQGGETKGQGGQTANDAAILEAAVERGFPKNHHLIIVTSRADKRKRLYKAVAAAGTVINCAVATGSRKADLDEQRQVLRQLAAETLGPRKKNLEPAAFEHIFDLTGFDPRSFVNNLEKLALYTAEHSRIMAADAAEVLEKTREDPIYLFTGALAERRPDLALYYLDSLLASGYHPMQLLAAAANQVRRILAVKSFVEDTPGGSEWKPSLSFDQFKARVLPQVIEHDKAVAAYAVQAGQDLEITPGSGKDKAGTDMVIAKNPKNAYPVYQVFIQADRFTGHELSQALAAIARADLAMKSTGTSPRAVLESLIFSVFAPVSESSEKTSSTTGMHSYNVTP